MTSLKLSDEMSVKIINKINSSLKQAVRIKGNYSRQNDILRVWNIFKDFSFTIVATSSRRFGHNCDILEIKSTGLERNSTLALMLMQGEILECRFESSKGSSDEDVDEFISLFLQSNPDQTLTRQRIEAEGHNKNDIDYPL